MLVAPCSEYQDRAFRNLTCKRLQVDEIWCFVYAKQAHVPKAKAAPLNTGDCWTWTAICADAKLVPSWLVGSRDGDAAKALSARDSWTGERSTSQPCNHPTSAATAR
jgi:hypothetical protein